MTAISLGPLLGHNHRLLRRQGLAGVGGHGHQQSFLAIDQVAGVEGGQLETVAVGDGVRGAGLNAIAAEDAAVVIDVIDLGVALGAADAFLFGIIGSFNVNAVGRAGGGAQKTGNAFFQAIFIALQLVQSAEALLKNRALIGQFFIGIVFHNRLGKHLLQGHGHSFGDAGEVTKDRHADKYNSETTKDTKVRGVSALTTKDTKEHEGSWAGNVERSPKTIILTDPRTPDAPAPAVLKSRGDRPFPAAQNLLPPLQCLWPTFLREPGRAPAATLQCAPRSTNLFPGAEA